MKNIYKFELRDRLLEMLKKRRIYKYQMPEIKLGGYSIEAQIEGKWEKFYIEEGSLLDYELQAAYIESFYPPEINGHSYMRSEIPIKKGDIVFDCGACEGFFTRYALIKGASKVICIEPSSVLAKGLRKTFDKEIDEGRVVIIEAGAGSIQGETKLIINKDMYCASTTNPEFAKEYENIQSETIQIVRIDDIARDLELKKIDVIKMDIEDAEIDALKGCIETVTSSHPLLMIATYHSYENSYYISEMARDMWNGYRVKYCGCYTEERPYRPYLTLCY